jgi:hypothetical protein
MAVESGNRRRGGAILGEAATGTAPTCERVRRRLRPQELGAKVRSMFHIR